MKHILLVMLSILSVGLSAQKMEVIGRDILIGGESYKGHEILPFVFEIPKAAKSWNDYKTKRSSAKFFGFASLGFLTSGYAITALSSGRNGSFFLGVYFVSLGFPISGAASLLLLNNAKKALKRTVYYYNYQRGYISSRAHPIQLEFGITDHGAGLTLRF